MEDNPSSLIQVTSRGNPWNNGKEVSRARHGDTAANHTDLQSGCGRTCVFAVQLWSNLWDLIWLRTSHYSMGSLLPFYWLCWCAVWATEPRSRGCAEYSIIIICCWSGSREYQLRSLHWPLLCYPMVTVRCTALPAICGVLSIFYISLYFKSNRLSIEKTITIHIQKIHGNGRPKKFIQYNVCDM